MGANQSSPAGEQVISSDPGPSTSVEFSPTLVSRLSSSASDSSSISSNSSSSTDDIVRRRLAAESAHLRTQEAEILSSISSALEKENLDKEKEGKGALSSVSLGRDIEEVREKVERMRVEREKVLGEGVVRARDGVRLCYSKNPQTPLDCWKEVEKFKNEVSKVEQSFLASLK